MQYKTLLLCFMLIIPTFFMGQVLQEIEENPTGLPDPDQYPFELYLNVGLPTASLTYGAGYKNMSKIFQDAGIEIPSVRPVNVFGGGLRYKRIYAELGGATQMFSSPLPLLFGDRYTVNSSYIIAWANLGYSVWQNRNSAVILRLGVGGGGSSYLIRYLENAGQVDFNELFTGSSGAPSTWIYHEDAFWDFSIELWRGRAKSRTSFGESIRVGFRQSLEYTEWETLDASSINAPMDRRTEIYLNGTFHLGYNFPKRAR